MLTRKPHKGDRLYCGKGRNYTVVETVGRIAWMVEDGKQDATCFIWGFSSPGGPVAEKPPKIDGGSEGMLYPNQYMSEIR